MSISHLSRSTVPHAAHLIVTGALAVLLVGGFLRDSVLPIVPGVVLLFALALYAIARPAAPCFGMLSRFMLLVYVLPFSVLLGYLIERDYIWMLTPRGQEVIQDRVLIAQTITLGTIGLLGLYFGYRAAALLWSPTVPQRSGTARRTQSLSLVVYLLLLGAALALSYLSAPKETILQVAYFIEQSDTAADKINFPAAYVVSYVILILLAIDIERDWMTLRRRAKVLLLTATVGYIVVVLQIMRGNRDSSGLIAALFGLFVTAPLLAGQGRRFVRSAKYRLIGATVPATILVALFIALGAARGMLSQVAERVGPRQTFLLGLSQNTWTAVLWTHLSATYEYREGLLRYKYGQTYLDYVRSLPPGFLTKALGIERPVERAHNLNYEDAAGISAGGLHAVVAPFKNFGAPGVFIVLALYGMLLMRLEQAHASGSLWGRVAWAGVLSAGFNWFWYGDMPFIRAVLAVIIAYWAYRVLLSIQLVPIAGRSARSELAGAST